MAREMDRPRGSCSRWRRAVTWICIGVVFVAALAVDVVTPSTYVMTPLYTIPVLIGAWRLSPRATAIVAIIANVVNVGSAIFQRTPLEIWPLYSTGLIFVGALAVFVAAQRDEIDGLLARERKAFAETEDERARLEAVVASAPFGILIVDAGSLRVSANLRATQLFGRQVDPVAGTAQLVELIRTPDGRTLSLPEFPSSLALRGATTAQVELVIARPDDRQIPILERAAPISGPNGQVLGAVAVFQDISSVKDLERMRTEWTTMVAHDLRQPVSVILGYTSLLARVAAQHTAIDRESAALEHVLSAARRLDRMIGDLIDVSRMLTGKLSMHYEMVQLPELLEQAVEHTVPAAENHVRVEVRGSMPPVRTDPARVEQVLSNLLVNAAKYSYPDTPIVVTVERRDSAAEVSVTNHGPGIPGNELPRLFTPFYRTLGAQAGRLPGLGLGLYICHEIVDALGGRIWAESVPGQTTTFYFTLPTPSTPSG